MSGVFPAISRETNRRVAFWVAFPTLLPRTRDSASLMDFLPAVPILSGLYDLLHHFLLPTSMSYELDVHQYPFLAPIIAQFAYNATWGLSVVADTTDPVIFDALALAPKGDNIPFISQEMRGAPSLWDRKLVGDGDHTSVAERIEPQTT